MTVQWVFGAADRATFEGGASPCDEPGSMGTERSRSMADPGHVFRRAFSWLPAQFASQSDGPVGPRRFGSTEHLSTEAIAAFVDGELTMKSHLRAASHLSVCPDC